MSVYSRLLRRYGAKRWFAAIASKVAPPLDRVVYRLSGRHRLASPRDVPTLFLTVTGRNSGRPHRVAVSFIDDEGTPVVVGTNWGKPASPQWSLNLRHNPRAEVEFEGKAWEVSAEEVFGQDQVPFWERFDEIWPPYVAYRTRARRAIPMFRLIRR